MTSPLGIIKSYLRGQQKDWDLNLGCLGAAYRASVHESTGLTPNMVMLGREVRLPLEVTLNTGKAINTTSYGEYVSRLRDHLQRACALTRKHLTSKTARQKESYESKQRFRPYHKGDYVWYASEINQLHITPKLRNPYDGPYLVVECITQLNYWVQFNERGTTRVVHYNKLKPYGGTKVLKWAKAALRRSKRNN